MLVSVMATVREQAKSEFDLLTDEGFFAYINSIDERLLATPEGRRSLCAVDPLCFALTYLPHHLKSPETDDRISFSDLHVALIEYGKSWVIKNTAPRQNRHVFIAPRSAGKALALNTPVLTANRGWATHGDLKVGDQVFDERGQPCNVVGVSEIWDDRPCYRITFSDGESIVADENHEWWVKDRYRTNPGVQDTKEIASKWLLTEARGFKEVRYALKVAKPLVYSEKVLPIPPYTLGVWLGDGNSDGGRITVHVDDADNLVAQLKSEGENPVMAQYPSSAKTVFNVHLAKPRPASCPREHSITRVSETRWENCKKCVKDFQASKKRIAANSVPMGPITNAPLIARLRSMNLLRNKHIPEEYFTGSYEQRLALFQGLMDTDGSIAAATGACEYGGTNERLVRDVMRLARTLGIKPGLSITNAQLNGRFISKCYRVRFNTELPIFRLPRKIARQRPVASKALTRRIVNVEQVENQPTSCIQVDSPSHQYLVGETLIPTHNSTWLFLILPLWSAAMGHDDFIVAFSDSASQAQMHLASFKLELDTNELLRNDFPLLCSPSKKESGATRGDTQKLYRAASGFTFAAGGVDTGVLGMKDGSRRPSRILGDDLEPGEAQYSLYQKQQRLTTWIDSILYLNEFAPACLTGTTTMAGSIIDDARKTLDPNEEHAPWVQEQNFKVHWFEPIVTDERTGEERSMWPGKWPLEYLESIRHQRSYKKNFLNDPAGLDGDFWNDEDFIHEELIGCTKTLLSIDPFVKRARGSDPCGIAVVSYLPKKVISQPGQPQRIRPARCMVEYADDINKTGNDLRAYIFQILERFPHIGRIYIEDNQGKDLWRDILHDLPVKLFCEPNTIDKDVRAAQLHMLYQAGRVVHSSRFSKAEEQMISFKGKNGPGHDDIIDAIGNGVFKFIKPEAKPVARATSQSTL